MKQFITSLLLLAFTYTVFAQNISGPRPVLSVYYAPTDTWVSFNDDLDLGCGVDDYQVKAEWTDIGSPDSYRVESIPFNPKSYLRVMGTTVLNPDVGFKLQTLGDDIWSSTIPLASNGTNLEFCYFGNQRNEFVISANGILSFDTSYAGGASSWQIDNFGKISPNANCGDNKDAILQMHDTDPTDSSALFDSYSFWDIKGAEGERYFIMGTHHMPMFDCGGNNGYATHQMLFFETTNIIEFHIQDKPLCDNWAGGYVAMGIQNDNLTQGFAAPGRDNLDQFQILDLTDGFYDTNVNLTFPINAPEGWRFIPDGPNLTAPVFGWYINWDSVTNTGTLLTTDPILNFNASQVPPSGEIIVTAVLEYTEFCSGNTYFSTEEVKFTLSNSIVGHIKEANSTDDTIELFDRESIDICLGDDHLLEMLIYGYDDTDGVAFDVEWSVNTFGNPPTVLQTTTTNQPWQITNALAGTYVYTCTVTHGTCSFSDSVEIRVFDDTATMEYPAPKTFCASDLDTAATPGNVFPTPSATAPQNEVETYYYTINNGGVWVNPLATDPTRSLDGIPDLSASFTNATITNADLSATFEITYHAHCPNNIQTDTIIIRNAPLVLDPAVGDPAANPVIEPSPLIVVCETNTTLHTADFDITGIETYIANGTPLADLTIVWESQTGGVILPNPMPNSYNTTTISVKVTITDPSDAAACEIELLFDLTVSTKADAGTPVNNLKLCENDFSPGIATFNGTNIENTILQGQDPTIYTVHYSYIDSGVTQNFDGPLPANFDSPTRIYTANVTDASGDCPSDNITFTLEVRTIPLVTPPTTDLILCETNTTNHTAEFDTSNWGTAILASNTTPINTDFVIEYDYVDSTGTSIIGANTIPNPLTSGSQTITIRARNVTAGEQTCSSGDETFDLVVNLKPVETPQTPVIVCSDEALNVVLDNYTTLTGNTYEWIATDNPNVTGETTTISTNGTITDVITNVTLVNQVVTYTITPTADASNANCVGDNFTIDVTIRPEPDGTDTVVPTCSAVTAGVDLNTITTLTGNTYSWVVTDNPDVTGETTGAQTGNMITETLTNTSTVNQDVIYTVTPTSVNNCAGNSFEVTISVGAAPIGTDPNITTCSDVALAIDLDAAAITTLTGNTFSWVATDNPNITGETVGVSTNGTITDTLNNITTSAQTVTYTVTPTSAAPNSCQGADFIVTVTVNPEPIQVVQVETICSNVALAVDLNTHTSLSNNTYEWIATDNPDVGGETSTIQTGVSITDTLTNTTLITQTVIYTITPTSENGCEGNPFTISIDVNPEPDGTDTVVPTCSAVTAGVDLNTITTLTGNTYSWVVTDNPDVTGETTGAQTGNMITETLTNTSTVNQDVIYTVTPTSVNNCAGNSFEVTISVGAAPIGTDPNITTCSDVALAIDLDAAAITTLTGNTFSWVATDNPNITGETVGVSTNGTITDTLNNITTSAQTVTYTVTPTSAAPNSCQGADFIVTVTVNPEPVFPATTPISSCSDTALSINLDTMNTNTLTGVTYAWTATANGTVTGVSANGITANITDVITNTSGAAVDVIYTIIPTSATGCVGETFEIVVTVGDEPSGTNDTQTICSDDTLAVDLNTLINKAGTTFAWTSSTNGTVTGVSANGTTANITDTINNISNLPVEVIYTITPTNGCLGNDFTVIITVNPEPVGTSPTPLDACSDIEFTINLEDHTSMANSGNTYEWQAIDNTDVDVTGETTTLTTSSIITETISNISATPQIVTYNITPISTLGCRGDLFTIDVEIGQKPVELIITPILIPFCSNDVLNINLNTFTTLTGNTYEWIATDNTDVNSDGDLTVIGETTTLTTGNTITDAIKNTSITVQQVTYTITPTSANGCKGDDFTITVDINPEPIGNSDIEETACSDVAVNFDLTTYTTLANNTYIWVATDNPNVTGETTVSSTSINITDTLTNLSANNQDVIYTVTPTSVNGCIGESFEITVNVGFEPVGIVSIIPACSDTALNIDLNTNTFIANFTNTNYTFSWYADNNNNVSGETTTPSTGNLITDVLTNTSGTLQNIIYHIIPTSAAPNSCVGDEFTITVEVGFEPVGTTSIENICNDVQLNLSLDNYTTLTGNTYKWYAIDNSNVTGETTTETNTNTINDTVLNTTGSVQIVDYMIVPTSAAGCEGDEFLVSVEVNPRPQFDLLPQYFICPDVEEVTIGEDNPDAYTYHWYEANDMNIIIGYDETLLVTEDDLAQSNGTYVLRVTDILGCTYSQFTSVSMAEQMLIAEVHVSDFNRPDNSIVIDVVGGSGSFEYTLTYEDYAGSTQTITQISPKFTNLVAATYQIEVTDLTGCSVGITSDDIYVLDYPPFFTPNGDLQNDTWQIIGSHLIPTSKIYIFNRFGKILAQVDPDNVVGWDGTYNGIQVPASDYWFTVEYLDPNNGKAKTVQGNFSIVRK